MSRHPKVTAYIEEAQPFAQPILRHLREIVHAAAPEIEEAIKWSMPAFLRDGEIICSMAAFKRHATFSFWRGELVTGDLPAQASAMGQFGRLASIDDLPGPEVLAGLIRKALTLTEAQVRTPRVAKRPKPPLAPPDDLAAGLAQNAAASRTFAGLPPGQQREYVEWIVEAKQPATRARRLAQAVQWLAEGKRRNWKYERR